MVVDVLGPGVAREGSTVVNDAPTTVSETAGSGGWMEIDPPTEGQVFLSTAPADREQRRRVIMVMIAATVVFVGAVPFAGTPLPPAWAFISTQESALLVLDLISAVLLFGQF